MCKWTIALLFGLAMVGMPLHGLEAAELPPHLQVGEYRLVLNGAGVRSKAFVPLYNAGLYLMRPSKSAAEVVAADEPMALRVEVTSRFVSQSSLIASLEEGFESSTGGRTQALKEQIAQFRKCFEEEIKKGDTFDLVYVPKHGIVVNKNGKLKGVVAGIEFKRALYGIWLSDKPADNSLKQALMTSGTVR